MSQKTPQLVSYAGVLRELSAAQAANLDERGIPKHLGRLQRAVTLEGYDKETRTVTMAVSSETPVERYFGSEVLSHDKSAIDLSRIAQGVTPLLFNHNYDAHLGRVQSAKVEDGVLRVVASFAGNPLALEKEGDVASGDLVAVSIGYIVDEWDIVETKDGARDYTGTKWQLLEVSLVTVPADPSVGVGRSSDPAPNIRSFRKMDDDDDTARSADSEDDEDDEDEGDDDGAESEGDRALPPSSVPNPPTPAAPSRTTTMAIEVVDNAAANTTRLEGLRALHKSYPTEFPERALKAAEALDYPVEDAKRSVADAIIAGSQRSDVPTIGDDVLGRMSDKEFKQYSLRDAYAAAINERSANTFSDKGAVGFAREISDDLRKVATERGIQVGGGILVPSVTASSGRAQRALASGGNFGQYTNFTQVDSTVIELLRSRVAVMALGAQMLSGLKGKMQMPRQNAAGSSNWVLEGNAGTNADLGLDDIVMQPNRLTMVQSFYRDALAQSAVSIDGLLAQDRFEVLKRSLDSAAIAGTGVAPIPTGLLNRTGLSATLSGSTRAQNGTVTPGQGGVPMTYVDYNNMEAAVATANGDIGTLRWLTTPKVKASGRSTPKIPGTASEFVWPDSAMGADGLQTGPLGYQALTTAASYLTGFTANSVNNLHAVILGVWDQLLIGDWGLSELIVDNVTAAASAKVNIIEHAFYDVNVRHLEAFNVCTSALPS